MQFLAVSVVLLLGPVAASSEVVNPLGKVIELLDSLSAKVAAEGAAEEKSFKEFVAWCEDAAANKNYEIETATATKAKLEANIGKQSGIAEAADADISQLADAIATADRDLKDATAVRNKEAADFAANEKELLDIISALGRAISIIGREAAKNPAAFAQVNPSNFDQVINSLSMVVDAASLSSVDRQKLIAFSQSQQSASADDEDAGSPAASVYKTHSGNILDVLEDLKEKAEEQMAALRKAEMNAKHNFGMLRQSLEDQMAADNKDLNAAKATKAAAEGASASAHGDLAATTKDLADGKAALDTVNTDCRTTAEDHAASVKGRAEELAALAQAKEILASTTSGAVSQTYSFVQLSQKSNSRLQTRLDLANAEVVSKVRQLAKQQHSAALAQLASRIAAVVQYGAAMGDDPFSKVKGLISDMIARLESEAGADATEKAYCDEQIAKTEAKKQDLEGNIAKLTTKVDIAAADSAGLKDDVKELQAELSALSKQQAEMDNMRRQQHADYLQAKSDLEQGLAGVRKALGVLRDYYGAAASFEQQPAVPTTHSKAGGAGGSIIGVLEVVESDFAKNLASEETQEADGATDYDRTTQANTITRNLKEQDVKYKTQNFKGLDKEVSELSSDRETESTELSAVLEYYSKIKARCIARPETYEARRGRREAEIAGLKEALSILENETAFIQNKKRGKFLTNRAL